MQQRELKHKSAAAAYKKPVNNTKRERLAGSTTKGHQ